MLVHVAGHRGLVAPFPLFALFLIVRRLSGRRSRGGDVPGQDR
jgi:hypothetical protein